MHDIEITTLGESESPRSALLEAIAWCARAAHSLRTLQIGPRVLERSYRETVLSVIQSRRLHLAGAPRPIDVPVEGRLLAYFPDAELACGAAEEASEGYFDVHNAPPWDTWVLLTEKPHRPRVAYGTCLVAWVPPTFLSRAQRGIETNPEDCICWLDDCPRDVQEIVRNSLFGTEAPQ